MLPIRSRRVFSKHACNVFNTPRAETATKGRTAHSKATKQTIYKVVIGHDPSVMINKLIIDG